MNVKITEVTKEEKFENLESLLQAGSCGEQSGGCESPTYSKEK